jgi:predicted subunit of tRNA(5-methylaminomethyl-2-thiouridylate) methyltransferase
MTERVPKAVREAVRKRASKRCEYCYKPEGVSLYPHHVEHIRPLLHLGNSELDNLAWACFQCNTNKSANIASYDSETKELTPLFNPRTQDWDEHFVMKDALITGKTAVGRVTVRILQINHPEQVKMRKSLINAGRW